MKTTMNNLIHHLCRPKIIGVIIMIMFTIMIVFFVSNILTKKVPGSGNMLLGSIDLSKSGKKIEGFFNLAPNITSIRLLLVTKDRKLTDFYGEDKAFSDSPLILQCEILDSSGLLVFDETVAGHQMALTNWYKPDWSAIINKDFGTLDDKLVCGNKYHFKIKVIKPWKDVSKAQVYLSYVN